MLKSPPQVSQDVPYLEIESLRDNQMKTKSLGWALIQNSWCTQTNGKFGHMSISRGKTT